MTAVLTCLWVLSFLFFFLVLSPLACEMRLLFACYVTPCKGIGLIDIVLAKVTEYVTSSARMFVKLYQYTVVIMLIFVNYAHFSKKCRTYAFTFYFKFGKTPREQCNKQVNGEHICPIYI